MGGSDRPRWPAAASSWLALAGVVMPVWILGLSTVLGLTRSGYDLLRDPISRLGAQGVPDAAVWQLGGFLAAAALQLAYAGAVWAAFRDLVLTALTVAAAALLAVSAAVPMPQPLHQTAGLLLVAGLSLTPLAAWWQFRRRPAWADVARHALVLGVLLLAWLLLLAAFEADRIGLWQRAFLLVALGWQLVVAWRIRRLATSGEGPATPA